MPNFKIDLIRKCLNSLKKIFKFIKNLKFFLPVKSKYLILDGNSHELTKILKLSNNYSILYTRYEEFNLLIILLSFFKFGYKGKSFFI